MRFAGTRVVILQPGTNDRLPRNGVPPEVSQADDEAMIDKAQRLDAAVVLCVHRGDGGQIARRRHITFLDDDHAGLVPRVLQPDGERLVPEGYGIVAQNMAPAPGRR